jgi:LacI family transcriptional regulator
MIRNVSEQIFRWTETFRLRYQCGGRSASGMSTLRDISRRSGYSVTTVSRALNGFDDVAEATRKRIEAVARELDYQPNLAARKLVSGRSGMVALVLAGPPAPFEHGHFFHTVAGCSRAFSRSGMDFVLHIGDGTDDVLETYSRLISRGNLDGFIVTAPDVRDPRIALLLERGVPFVVHGRDPAQGGYPFVDADNAGIARAAVDHLARLGHRRVALLNGPASRAYASERLRGHREAVAAHGLDADPQLVRDGDTSEAYGRTATRELLSLDRRPTAIVCCNALVAAGVCEALAEAGLGVPRDVSVVAHDDLLPQADTAAFDPPLTVTRLGLVAAFEPLADLFTRLAAGESPGTLFVEQPAEFVTRSSTAPR